MKPDAILVSVSRCNCERNMKGREKHRSEFVYYLICRSEGHVGYKINLADVLSGGMKVMRFSNIPIA